MSQYTVENHLLLKDGNPVSWKRSPNHGGVITPEIIVLHYTGDMGTGGLQWLCDSQSGVSAHLWIARTGKVWQLVPFNIRAWHAGRSEYNGRPDVNTFSIGIEMQGIGRDWPDEQIEELRGVLKALSATYEISDIVGHEDVAPGRKPDPGPMFPWDKVTEDA